MPQINRSRIYIIIALAVLAFIVIFVVLLSRIKPAITPSPTAGKPTPANTPTMIPYDVRNLRPSPGEPTIFQQTEEYQKIQNDIRLTEAPEIERGQKVTVLLRIVPYKGKLFQFDYNTKALSYQVIFDKDRVLEANTEFDTFLKENGIESRFWFRDLKIVYQ